MYLLYVLILGTVLVRKKAIVGIPPHTGKSLVWQVTGNGAGI